MALRRKKSSKTRKSKKILIRMNREQRRLADELADGENKNISTLFRDMLRDHEKTNVEKEIHRLAGRHKKIIKEFEKLIEK